VGRVTHLRLRVAFHKFLTMFSERPGRSLAISDQWFPNCRWACTMTGGGRQGGAPQRSRAAVACTGLHWSLRMLRRLFHLGTTSLSGGKPGGSRHPLPSLQPASWSFSYYSYCAKGPRSSSSRSPPTSTSCCSSRRVQGSLRMSGRRWWFQRCDGGQCGGRGGGRSRAAIATPPRASLCRPQGQPALLPLDINRGRVLASRPSRVPSRITAIFPTCVHTTQAECVPSPPTRSRRAPRGTACLSAPSRPTCPWPC